MKIKLFAICILSLLFTVSLSAQSYTFRVIGTKGNNTIDGKPLKVGMTLTDNQTIMIASNGSYLGLMHKTGKTLELQDKGSYQVKGLESKIKGSGNLNSRYAKFVANELSQDGGPSAARSRHMKKTGSVERAIGLVQAMLPKSSDLYGSTLAVKWFLKESNEVKEADVKEYKIYVTSMEDEVLETLVTTDKHAFVDVSGDKYKGAEQLIVKVLAIKQNGEAFEDLSTIDGRMVQILDAETKAEIAEEMKEFADNSNSPLTKLAEASYYEENKLYSDAIRAYEQALELSGNVESFKEMYDSFLIRNALNKEGVEKQASTQEGK